MLTPADRGFVSGLRTVDIYLLQLAILFRAVCKKYALLAGRKKHYRPRAHKVHKVLYMKLNSIQHSNFISQRA